MEDWHKYLLEQRKQLLHVIPRLESGRMTFFAGSEDISAKVVADNRRDLAEIEAILTKAEVPYDA